MKQSQIEDKASSIALKITGIFLGGTFGAWTLINLLGARIAAIFPSQVGNTVLIFLELLLILVVGIIAYYVIFNKLVKQLKAEDRLAFIFEENPNPLLVFDKNSFKIIESNREAQQLFEFPESQLNTSKITEFVYRNQRDNFIREFNSFTEDNFFMRDVRLVQKKGQDIFCNLHYKVAEDGLIIASIYDITPLVQLKYSFSLLLTRHKQFETQVGDHVRTQFNYISGAVREVENTLLQLQSKGEHGKEIEEIQRRIKELDFNFQNFATQFNSLYGGLTESVNQINLEEFNI